MPPPHFPPHHLPGAEDGSVPPEQIFPSANPVLDLHHPEDADHDQEFYILEDGNSSQSRDDSLSGLSEYRYYAFELSSEEGEASNSSDHGLSAYEPGHVLVGEPPSELDAKIELLTAATAATRIGPLQDWRFGEDDQESYKQMGHKSMSHKHLLTRHNITKPQASEHIFRWLDDIHPWVDSSVGSAQLVELDTRSITLCADYEDDQTTRLVITDEALEKKHRCFVEGCSMTKDFISELLRHTESQHSFFYCNTCCTGFGSSVDKDAHLPRCTPCCISPDCDLDSTSPAPGDSLLRRHGRAPGCPTMGRVEDRDRLEYLRTSYRIVHPTGGDFGQKKDSDLIFRPEPRQKRLENLSQHSLSAKESRNAPSKTVSNRVKSAVAKVCKACRRPGATSNDQKAKEARLLNIIRYCTSKTGIDPFIRSSLELDAPELLAEHNESMRSISTIGGSHRTLPEVPVIPAPSELDIFHINREMRETQPTDAAEKTRCDAHFDDGMAQSIVVLDEIPLASLGSGEDFTLSDEQNEELEALMLEWQKDGTLLEGPAGALPQPLVQDSRTTAEFFPELTDSVLR